MRNTQGRCGCGWDAAEILLAELILTSSVHGDDFEEDAAKAFKLLEDTF